MTTLLLMLGGSFALCVLIMPLARKLACRCGLVDRPDGRRKIHGREVPLAGGLAVLFSSVVLLTGAFLIDNPLRSYLEEQSASLLGLLLAAVFICAVGVVDDLGRLRGRHKLLGQIVAVIILIQSGLVVQQVRLFGWEVELGLFAMPLTACWLLAVINSLNLIDGMDGLLGVVGVLISLVVGVIAAVNGHMFAACVSVTLGGTLAGFLCFNLPPATVFLGDTGSMLIGLVIGAMGIECSAKGPVTIAIAVPMALLTIPFFDTAAAIIRRKLTGRSIYTTDRGHLHHCLQRRGFSDWRVLVCVGLLSLLVGAGALVSQFVESEWPAILASASVIATLVLSKLFGHAECLLLKRRLWAFVSSLLGRRKSADAPHVEVHLQGTTDWTELMGRLITVAIPLKLVHIRLNVNAPALHEGYYGRWDQAHVEGEESRLWSADLPLACNGQIFGRVEVRGQFDDVAVAAKISTLSAIVENFEHLIAVDTKTKTKPVLAAPRADEQQRQMALEPATGSS